MSSEEAAAKLKGQVVQGAMGPLVVDVVLGGRVDDHLAVDDDDERVIDGVEAGAERVPRREADRQNGVIIFEILF